MLKKRSISLLLVICIIASLSTMVDAVAERASTYLNSYATTLFADGNGKMSVDVEVYGLKTMNKIGVKTLRIEEKYTASGSWHSYDVLHASDDPDYFYDYGKKTYLNTFAFNGTPGYYYQVIITVYAEDSQGSDTGSITTSTIRCK